MKKHVIISIGLGLLLTILCNNIKGSFNPIKFRMPNIANKQELKEEQKNLKELNKYLKNANGEEKATLTQDIKTSKLRIANYFIGIMAYCRHHAIRSQTLKQFDELEKKFNEAQKELKELGVTFTGMNRPLRKPKKLQK